MMKISILTLACFFLSGLAGLIYQVIWVRLLDKVMGSAPFAVATVLTVFMGGLALGSYAAGRAIDRGLERRKLLVLYGKLEGLIGIYGLLLPVLLVMARPLYGFAYRSFFESFWLYTLIAFLGCALLLVIPTALMGATLPILCRFYVEEMDHVGRRTGFLYGLNTVGAALGAFLTGFYLVESHGVWGSIFFAAALNLFVAIACMWSGRASGPSRPSRSLAGEARRARELPSPSSVGRPPWPLWVFAVSGFCAMSFEVFWTRLIGLLLGPTSYSFTLVVGTFIVGLAIGAVIFGRLADRCRDAAGWLLATQVGAALWALMVSHLLGNSPFFFAKLIYAFKDDFGSMAFVQSVVLFSMMVGPTLLWGAAFPLVNRIVTHRLEELGGSVGRAYAFNTVGAILGSFCAGFLVLPFFGKELGMRVVATLQVSFALAVWFYLLVRGAKKWALVGPLGLLLLSAFILSLFPAWERRFLSYGRYHNFTDMAGDLRRTGWLEALLQGGRILQRHEEGREVVFFRDGVGGFTTVERLVDSLGTEKFTLLNSGKPDASSHGDRSTQTLLAHVPLLFHPGAKEAMVLGLASGMTAGEALHYPVERVDVLEINPAVVEAAKYFEPWNNGCLSDPRCRVIEQDGRNHLALGGERYDVIISEPSNPWMAGLANLYTREFFQVARHRLRSPGIFVQWIHSYEMDWETFALVGRTFGEVFPEGVLFTTLAGGDYLLVGTTGGLGLDPSTARQNLVYAAASENMRLRGISMLFGLIVSEDLAALFGPGPIHTDNRPLLEFAAPRVLHVTDTVIEERISERGVISARTNAVITAGDNVETLLDLVEFSASAHSPLFSLVDPEELQGNDRARYAQIMDDYCGRQLVADYETIPDGPLKRNCAHQQAALIREHLASAPGDARAFYSLGVALEAAGEEAEAMDAYVRAVSLDPFLDKAWNNLGIAFLRQGELERAEEAFQESISANPSHANAYFNMARVLLQKGDRSLAASYLEEGLLYEEHARARSLLNELQGR